MIYLTGDTHSSFHRFSSRIFPEQQTMTKEDFVIVCGDFGGIWSTDPEDREEKYWLDWLEGKNFTTLFIDGNHENHDRLAAMPVHHWHGGKIHRIRPSVLHLMRGQVFEIEDASFFTFGGARSHDIRDGILEADDPRLRRKSWRRGKSFRINHVSWWEQEMPSAAEMEEGERNFAAAGWKVDFILTHCLPTSLHLRTAGQKEYEKEGGQGYAGGNAASGGMILTGGADRAAAQDYVPDPLTEYLETIRARCSYRAWFSGHYHMDHNVTEKDKVLYRQIVRLL